MIVRYTRRAEYDLTNILDYIEERSPKGARNVKLAIKRTIDNIGHNPDIGHDAGVETVRVFAVKKYPYLVYWTVEAGEVWIVHIRHGSRLQWRG